MQVNPQQDIRILHVDDDSSVMELARDFLEREDDRFAIETATSADEGMKKLCDRPPDCVVSDYNMPGMDGIEFLQAVREEYPELPFILFTGKGSEAVASEAIAADVTDYLQKAVGSDQYELLANRIRNAVHARRESKRADRQEQLMRLTEFAGDTGGFELDTDTGEVLLTDGACQILDVPEQANHTYKKGIEYFHPDDRENIQQSIQRVLETDEQTHGTWRYQHPDGKQKLLDITYTAVTANGDTATIRGAVHDVTDHRERQRELRLLQQAIDNTSVPITFADPSQENNPLVYINDGFEEMTGYSPEEALGNNCRFLQGEDTDSEKVAALSEAIDNEETISVELRNYRKDGTEFWNRLTVTPIYNDDGELIRYLGTQEDVTDRKERERELNAERRFIEQALDTLDDLFYVLDTDGTIRRWNERLPETTGYTDRELADMQAVELFPADEHRTVANAIQMTVTGETVTFEAELLTADDERRPYEFTGARLTDTDGNTTGLVGIGRDLTKRKQRERRFQALVEESNDFISIVNTDGEFQYQSPSVERILGYEPEETIGDTAWEYVHPDDRADLIEAFEQGIADPDANPVFEYRARHADGSWRWLEANGNNQLDNPAVEGYIVNSRDITERKEHERKLAQTHDLMANMEQLADVGAWEYDLETETLVITDGTYRIYGLEPGADLTLEEAFEHVHPESRERLTDRFTECVETGEPYEIDLRLTTAEGTQRWVTARGERVDKPDSGSVARGYIRDVTEEKTRERQLNDMNRAIQDLLKAETSQEVADIGVKTARDVLELDANAVHLCEADDTLTPVAQTDELTALLGEVPPLSVTDSIAGRVYQRGEPTVIEDVHKDPDIHDVETDLRGHIYLPLADHGVLIAGSEAEAAFDQQDLAVGELLARSLVAAFNRISREQTAHQRQQQLSLFFEESPLGAVQWDDEFQFERMNSRAEEILGYSEAELRGESRKTIVAEADHEQVHETVEALLAADGGTEVMNSNVRNGGERLTCEWHHRVVTDENGDAQSVFSKFQDVTDRERRKSELEEYEAIIRALSDAVYVLDEDGQFAYVNDEFVELVGYGREMILGNAPSLLKNEDAVERAERELGRLLSDDGPEAVTFEVTVHPREGDPIVCEDHMSVLPYEGEQFNGSVGTLRDITDRKARERELETVNSQYQTLLENFPDGAVFLFNTDLEYVRAGGQELTAVGLSVEDVVGATPHDLFPEGIADEIVHSYQETLDGTSCTFNQEYDGEQYRIQTTPVGTGDKAIAYGLAVSENVTEETERRQELKRQKNQLEEFASIVSHDLRSPLSVAEGNLELAQETCESDHLARAADAINRGQKLIDDLLTLARQSEDVLKAQSVPIEDIAKRSWQTVDTEQATLESEASLVIKADQSQLRELLENLYRNAIEHGGNDVTVSVGAMDDGFYVMDTGPGIPESDREDVFEAGYSTSEDGTGFGLRIVEQIADAHGWDVSVTESEQGGARFGFTGVEKGE